MIPSYRPLSTAEIESVASDWVVRRDAGLSAEEQVRFERWKAADLRHSEAIARHDKAWSLLDQPRVDGRVMEMVEELAIHTRRRRAKTVGALAAVMVVVAAGFFTHQFWTRTEQPLLQTAVVHHPDSRLLPDGTRVDLRSGAEIRVAYEDDIRRVHLLRGDALFHVKKDPDRPFLVVASGVEIRAVGTAFAVVLSQEELDVVVTEGRVAVEHRQNTTSASASLEQGPGVFSALVDAGERLSLHPTRAPVLLSAVPISKTEISDLLAWRSPRVEFSDTPLQEAVELLNRHSDLKLVVGDVDLARLPVNGLFRADNTETLIRLLESGFDLQTTRVGDTITLTKRR